MSKISLDKYINTHFPNQTTPEIELSKPVKGAICTKSRITKLGTTFTIYIVTASSPPLLILEYCTYRQIETMGISLRNVEPKVDDIKEDDLKVEMTTFFKIRRVF